MQSRFTQDVIQVVSRIPKGKVATYKQIAEICGKAHGSRGVSWILHTSSTKHKLPWHRVINSKGMISFEKGSHNYRKQRKLLEAEGVVLNSIGVVDLQVYRWKKSAKKAAVKNSSEIKMFRD